MKGVFQRFDRNEKIIRQKTEKSPPGKNFFPYAVKTLIEKLQERGYTVLCDINDLNGIPESIIVGSELSAIKKERVKTHFQEIAKELDITEWFVPGTSYYI
ncbi:hypothetical protein KKA72_01570 [Patescibacteria group bacterium]|nr:hypothetical protein [Patescibacteria group bacterium]MBU1877020.1 hypothetical protein [Patescibacteria group bacterium]